MLAGLFSLLILLFHQKALSAEVSITMDDFNLDEATMFSPQLRNQKLLKTFRDHKLKAALFVAAKMIETPERKGLLQKWTEQGHLIGNHTFSHHSFSKIGLAPFERDILKADESLSPFATFQRIFRFPYLAEGDTVEKRDQIREWLKSKGYRFGHVTIDASDWYVDQRMRDKLSEDPDFDLSKYRNYYLDHIWDRAQYYNEMSKQVLGREVKHTLLVHFNLLNVLFMDDLLKMFKSHGWKIISAEEAFRDPVFSKEPKSMPSGQSVLWGLAKETGKYNGELRYPGEDDIYEKPKMDALGL